MNRRNITIGLVIGFFLGLIFKICNNYYFHITLDEIYINSIISLLAALLGAVVGANMADDSAVKRFVEEKKRKDIATKTAIENFLSRKRDIFRKNLDVVYKSYCVLKISRPWTDNYHKLTLPGEHPTFIIEDKLSESYLMFEDCKVELLENTVGGIRDYNRLCFLNRLSEQSHHNCLKIILHSEFQACLAR